MFELAEVKLPLICLATQGCTLCRSRGVFQSAYTLCNNIIKVFVHCTMLQVAQASNAMIHNINVYYSRRIYNGDKL